MNTNRYALLMTACIEPSEKNVNAHAIKRSSSLDRLEDYKTSLKYWLKYDDPRIKSIIFIENSGFSLAELEEISIKENIFNRNIEFIQIRASAIPDGLHYGYSELEMIDELFKKSEVIKDDDYVIKTTGRLYFPNLSKLLNTIGKGSLFVGDSRDFIFFKKKQRYVITTLFVVKKVFYSEFLYNTKDSMTKSTSLMEWLFFSILKPLHLKQPKKVVLRFPFNVDPVGIGAHWNINYVSSNQKFVSAIRNVSRTLFPFLWI